MTLIFWYLGFMITGDVLAYLLGGLVEYEWGSQASLIVFLALYFLFLWVSWILAVRVRGRAGLRSHRPATRRPLSRRSSGCFCSSRIDGSLAPARSPWVHPLRSGSPPISLARSGLGLPGGQPQPRHGK
jgi:hypothetical protein